jgi:hypothetical protein
LVVSLVWDPPARYPEGSKGCEVNERKNIAAKCHRVSSDLSCRRLLKSSANQEYGYLRCGGAARFARSAPDRRRQGHVVDAAWRNFISLKKAIDAAH